MIQVDYDILLPVAHHDEEAAFLLLGAIADQRRDPGVAAVT